MQLRKPGCHGDLVRHVDGEGAEPPLDADGVLADRHRWNQGVIPCVHARVQQGSLRQSEEIVRGQDDGKTSDSSLRRIRSRRAGWQTVV